MNTLFDFTNPEKQLNGIKSLLFKIVCVILCLIRTQNAIGWISDPGFTVGTQTLINKQLSSYPDSNIYSIAFPNALPAPTIRYDIVISINTFYFMQSNTIGWNFTKFNIQTTGFDLKYEAGLNSIVYQLRINYFAIQNAYQDIQIAYFDYKCSILNQSAGYRSQNVSYTLTKFNNDSSIARVYCIQSFNLTNPQNDYMTHRINYYQSNLTFTIQLYVYGLFKMHDIQFYIIFHNKAMQAVNMERIVLVQQYGAISSGTNITTLTNIRNNIKPNYKFRDRYFVGLRGFSFTKIGHKRFQFDFNSSLDFTFNINSNNSGALSFVDLIGIGIYRLTCGAGEAYIGNQTCGACSSGQYIDTTYSLDRCKGCHYTCSAGACFDQKQTSCDTCNTTTRQPVFIATIGNNTYNKCTCKAGYFEANQPACYYCPAYILGCNQCNDNTTCLVCGSTLPVKFNGKCYCPTPVTQTYYYSACRNRIIGCQTYILNGATYVCTECYVQRGFTITTTFGCTCQNPTYQFPKDINGYGQYWCKSVCGDGKYSSDQQCDDNNTAPNDGCDSLCFIERNFTCTQVLGVTSICKYNLTTELIFQSSQRVLYKNTAVLNFTLQPYTPFWDQIGNWSSYVVTNMPIQKITHLYFCPFQQYLRCNLTLTVDYTDHLENQISQIYLNLTKHTKIKYNSRLLYFIPKGNVAQISYQKQQTLDRLQTLQIIVLVLVILSFAIFLASVYFQKMIGVQLMMTVQYLYFIMTPLTNNPVQLVPLQRNIKYSNGFNTIMNYTFYRYEPLPNQLNHQFYQKQFIMNMNVMLCGLLLVMLILIIVKFIKLCQQSCVKVQSQNKIFDQQNNVSKTKFNGFYVLYWNKIFFIYVFFVMYQVLFNSVITTILENPTQTFFSASLNFFAAFISFFIVIIGILSIGYWYYQGNKKKGRVALQETQIIPYKFQICKKEYILAFAVINPIKIWIIAIFYTQAACYYIILPIIFIYFIFLAVLRPYIQPEDQSPNMDQQEGSQFKVCLSIHNFGICFNQFCLIVFTVLCLLWNVSVDNYSFDNQFPDMMLYCGISILVLLNIVAILRIFYRKLGAVLFCQRFKVSNPNAINAETAYDKMRKIVRDNDLKRLDETDPHDDDLYTKKQKMKILHDIKKARNNYVNWKDDRKPKFTTDESSQSSQNEQNLLQNQQQILNDTNLNVNNPLNATNAINTTSGMNTPSILNDSSGFQNSRIKKKRKRPGLVEMQTLLRSQKQSNYKIQKSHQRKYAGLNKSVIDSLLDKKYVQNPQLYIPKNVFGEQIEQVVEQKKETVESQNINNVKQRLRKDFEQKRGKRQKNDFKSSAFEQKQK